jgi:hypothetical protein
VRGVDQLDRKVTRPLIGMGDPDSAASSSGRGDALVAREPGTRWSWHHPGPEGSVGFALDAVLGSAEVVAGTSVCRVVATGEEAVVAAETAKD